ncbi:hypothetical protein DEI81_13275 [Curtobacterium sp. MCBD17_013]|nr:hypothetical protein DEI81_13275 [Curtobacterium sp. MCBD17_013]
MVRRLDLGQHHEGEHRSDDDGDLHDDERPPGQTSPGLPQQHPDQHDERREHPVVEHHGADEPPQEPDRLVRPLDRAERPGAEREDRHPDEHEHEPGDPDAPSGGGRGAHEVTSMLESHFVWSTPGRPGAMIRAG